MKNRQRDTCHGETGFSLIEVLVTVVILGVGLLGMAGMQLRGVQANQGAHLRSQANSIASDIIDRLRANVWTVSSYNDFTLDIESESAPTAQDCESSAASCNQDEVVIYDKARWYSIISETLIPVNGGASDDELEIDITPNADGKSSQAAITIRWTSMGEVEELPLIVHLWSIQP